MEKIIAEFKAKSLFVDSLDCGLFFSWDLFDQGKRIGVEIDLHALADVSRNKIEIIKLMYLCFNAYSTAARLLGLTEVTPPSLEQIEAWVLVCPNEAAKAIEYAVSQLRERFEESLSKKKREYPSDN